MKPEFQKDLEALINKHSMEHGSGTPDFILAEYLCRCLKNFNETVYSRQTWWGNTNGIAFDGSPPDGLSIRTASGKDE